MIQILILILSFQYVLCENFTELWVNFKLQKNKDYGSLKEDNIRFSLGLDLCDLV